MQKINSSDELLKQINQMNKENSVTQFIIPGKGKFTIVLQEEIDSSIQSEVDNDPELKKMIHDSRAAYKEGKAMSTSEFIKTLSPGDFSK